MLAVKGKWLLLTVEFIADGVVGIWLEPLWVLYNENKSAALINLCAVLSWNVCFLYIHIYYSYRKYEGTDVLYIDPI